MQTSSNAALEQSLAAREAALGTPPPTPPTPPTPTPPPTPADADTKDNALDGRPNFGKMMREKRESISQLREKGHPVDRRDKFEDGQPARDNGIYDVKEERELMKKAALEHPKTRAFKPRVPRGRPNMVGAPKGPGGGGTQPPPKLRDEL